jgi:hypothetical protein
MGACTLRADAMGAAVEIGMPPQFVKSGKPVQHSLEKLFNASGWDILSAIEKGFRAQVDVKGKLAELCLFRQLDRLQKAGVISTLEWHDQDGVPDFSMAYNERIVRVECKNVRSPIRAPKTAPKRQPTSPAPAPAWRVEIQKTRNQLTGGPARGYKNDEFEILAVCLFNQNRKWEFLFIATAKLQTRPDFPDYLTIMQFVPPSPQGDWKATLEEVLVRIGSP